MNELDTSLDVQAFQKAAALQKLSSITFQQSRRNVIYPDDASTAEKAFEESHRQTADMFLQNLDRISKMQIMERRIVEPGKADPTRKLPLEILKGEEFIKLKQRGSIMTARRSNIFVSPKIPAVLGTATHSIRRKSLRIEEPMLPLYPESPVSTPTTTKDLDSIDMQIEISPIHSFTPLEAAAVSCILDECLQQLAMIGFVIPARVDPRWDDTFTTIDETYGIPDEPKRIFREDMGLLPLVLTADEKMQRDRNYMYEVLRKVFCDLRNNRRFDSLQEEINNTVRRREGERNLEMNAQIGHNQAEQLRELLESDKKANEENKKRTTKLAQESDARVDHTVLLNSGKLSYTERWAKARLEQQELKLKLQKTEVLNEISDCSKEYSTEQIISAEVDAYLQTDIENKEGQVDTWTKRYNEEVMLWQQKVDEMKTRVEEQKLEIEEMRALKDERQKFIDEYIAEEKRLQEDERYQERLNRAATIIQSAWKRYMIRRELMKQKKRPKKRNKRLKRRGG